MKNELYARRAGQPEIAIPGHVPVPEAKGSTLANGVRLHVLDNSDEEVVRMSFVFRAGSSLQAVPFSASAVVNLLSEGTKRYSDAQIAERLDFHGSYYDVTADRDYTVVTFCCLKKFFAETCELAEEILLRPVFPEENVRTYCGKQKQRLTIERSKVAFRARELFARTMFGAAHPYGVSSPAEAYDTLTREEIAGLYERLYVAENCFVVASGKIDPQTEAGIGALAGRIPNGSGVAVDGFPEPNPESYAFVRHEGAVQSAVRVGIPLFPRTHPDYIPMQVVSSILGGYFGSRLVRNLRGECGYTYGVFAGMVNLEYAGYLAVATEVAAGATADALIRIYGEMERLCTEPVPEEELDMVKNIMTGEVMRILDGPFGIADVTIENIQNGTDNGYIDRLVHEVRGFTPQRVMETARKYLDPDRFVTVVAGDRDPRVGSSKR